MSKNSLLNVQNNFYKKRNFLIFEKLMNGINKNFNAKLMFEAAPPTFFARVSEILGGLNSIKNSVSSAKFIQLMKRALANNTFDTILNEVKRLETEISALQKQLNDSPSLSAAEKQRIQNEINIRKTDINSEITFAETVFTDSVNDIVWALERVEQGKFKNTQTVRFLKDPNVPNSLKQEYLNKLAAGDIEGSNLVLQKHVVEPQEPFYSKYSARDLSLIRGGGPIKTLLNLVEGAQNYFDSIKEIPLSPELSAIRAAIKQGRPEGDRVFKIRMLRAVVGDAEYEEMVRKYFPPKTYTDSATGQTVTTKPEIDPDKLLEALATEPEYINLNQKYIKLREGMAEYASQMGLKADSMKSLYARIKLNYETEIQRLGPAAKVFAGKLFLRAISGFAIQIQRWLMPFRSEHTYGFFAWLTKWLAKKMGTESNIYLFWALNIGFGVFGSIVKKALNDYLLTLLGFKEDVDKVQQDLAEETDDPEVPTLISQTKSEIEAAIVIVETVGMAIVLPGEGIRQTAEQGRKAVEKYRNFSNNVTVMTPEEQKEYNLSMGRRGRVFTEIKRVNLLIKNKDLKDKLQEIEIELRKNPDGIDSSTYRKMMKTIREIERQNKPEQPATPTGTGGLEGI